MSAVPDFVLAGWADGGGGRLRASAWTVPRPAAGGDAWRAVAARGRLAAAWRAACPFPPVSCSPPPRARHCHRVAVGLEVLEPSSGRPSRVAAVLLVHLLQQPVVGAELFGKSVLVAVWVEPVDGGSGTGATVRLLPSRSAWARAEPARVVQSRLPKLLSLPVSAARWSGLQSSAGPSRVVHGLGRDAVPERTGREPELRRPAPLAAVSAGVGAAARSSRARSASRTGPGRVGHASPRARPAGRIGIQSRAGSSSRCGAAAVGDRAATGSCRRAG